MGKIHKKLEVIVEHDESCDQMQGRGGCSCEMRMFGKRLSIETSATGVPQQPDLAATEDYRIRLFTFTRALTNNQTKELYDVLLGSRFAEKSELVLTPAEGKPGILHITGLKAHPSDVRRFAQNAGLQMR